MLCSQVRVNWNAEVAINFKFSISIGSVRFSFLLSQHSLRSFFRSFRRIVTWYYYNNFEWHTPIWVYSLSKCISMSTMPFSAYLITLLCEFLASSSNSVFHFALSACMQSNDIIKLVIFDIVLSTLSLCAAQRVRICLVL